MACWNAHSHCPIASITHLLIEYALCTFGTRLQVEMPASCWDDREFPPNQVVSSSPQALEAYSKGIQVRARCP